MGSQAFIGFLDLVLDLFNLMGFVFTYFGDQQEIRGLACLIYRAGSYITTVEPRLCDHRWAIKYWS